MTTTQPHTETTVLKLDALPPTWRCHKDCKTTIILLIGIIHPCPKFNGGIAKAPTLLVIISRNVDVITHPWAKPNTGWLYRHNNQLYSFQWRHNGRDSVSTHQPRDCLLNRLFRHRWKKTSRLRVTGLCEGNSLVTGEFPAQRASNAKNASIWWRHQVLQSFIHSRIVKMNWYYWTFLWTIYQRCTVPIFGIVKQE